VIEVSPSEFCVHLVSGRLQNPRTAGCSDSEWSGIQLARFALPGADMNPDHIDFISAYCDRWCERCPLTHRCSVFTAMAAMTMCEDERAGLELAFGRAPDDSGVVAPPPDWLRDLVNVEMSADAADEFARRQDQRRERVEATSIMQMAKAFMHLGHDWLMANHHAGATEDSVVREAFEVAAHDLIFIRVKLHRALDGQDSRNGDDGSADDHPVQNDWNGSAKIALISLERSSAAWSVLASASGQETPAVLAEQLKDLRAEVEREFPDAWSFVRPGFDAG